MFGVVLGLHVAEVVLRLPKTFIEPDVEADWTRSMTMFPDIFSPPAAGTVNTHAHRGSTIGTSR